MRALVFAAIFLGSSCLYPSYAQDEGKTAPVAAPQTAPAQERTLRHSRIMGRKSDNPRPTTVKSVGTGGYIPAIVTAEIAMIVWAVITGRWVVTGECIEIVRQIETATWIAADTESEGREIGTAEIGTAAGI